MYAAKRAAVRGPVLAQIGDTTLIAGVQPGGSAR
jgi:hypothetical protein